MKLQPEIYKNFLNFAETMADASGELLREYFTVGASVNKKADASPVTEADKEVELLLRSMIAGRFPEHSLVGEEFGSSGVDCEYKWVIDPIDGTKSFIAGYPIFTTLIALLYKDVPVVGVIDQPILKKRWSGIKSSDFLPHPNQKENLDGVVVASTSAAYFSPDEAMKFSKLSAECSGSIAGGDAYAYAMLVDGKIDIVVDAGMKPYDFCALVPVLEEKGAIISDWEGRPLTLHSSGRVLAAANYKLHSEAIKMLRD